MLADLKRTFSKGDTTNWSDNSYRKAEIVIDKIQSYRNDNLS